jgi:hypothetical protein
LPFIVLWVALCSFNKQHWVFRLLCPLSTHNRKWYSWRLCKMGWDGNYIIGTCQKLAGEQRVWVGKALSDGRLTTLMNYCLLNDLWPYKLYRLYGAWTSE